MLDLQSDSNPSRVKKIFYIVIAICILLLILLTLHIRTQLTAPDTFLPDTVFNVESGMNVRDIAKEAQEKGIVRSKLLLYAVLAYSYEPNNIYAGGYLFKEPVGLFAVAKKLAEQKIIHDTIALTIPEGVRLTQIAEIAQRTLAEDFVPQAYLTLTEGREGYMFPETYFVPETFEAKELVELQEITYEAFMEPLRKEIEASAFTEYEVLISMGLVSGILQNRLEINMALQADASIEYVLDTPLNELPEGQLASELREKDSPYNTYLNTGLPPTPIGNPGEMAILAVLRPAESDYFFYITDADGQFFYAETFAEHNQNIAKHLR